jgi:hypothetical protein
MRNLLFLTASLALLLTVGCGGPATHSLAFAPTAGETRELLVDMETRIESDMPGAGAMNQDSSQAIKYGVTVDNVSAAGSELSFVYKVVTVDMGMDPLALMGAGSSKTVIRGVRDQSFNVSVAGDRVTLSGVDELIDAVAAEQSDDDNTGAKAMLVKSVLEQFTGEHVLQPQMEGLFGWYPPEPIGIGESWTVNRKQSAQGMDIDMALTYTLDSVEEGMASVSLSGTITGEMGDIANMPGMDAMGDMGGAPGAQEMIAEMMKDMEMTISGSMTGTGRVETETGWLDKATSDSEMKIDMKMGGQNIPQTIHSSTKISAL